MKIAFTYLGPLRYRGRLFKQIKTLQEAGHECMVIHGRTEDEEPDYSSYNFPVIPIRVVQDKFKPLTLATQLLFAYRAADLIQSVRADAVVCIALQSALSGALAKRKKRNLFFVYDSNELSLETFASRLKHRIWRTVQDYVLKLADVIMHAERHRLDYFHNKYPTNAKPFLLENLPYYRKNLPSRKKSKELRFVYLGILAPDRYCTVMLEAFAGMREQGVSFDLVGYYGSRKYRREVEGVLSSCRADNVRVLPPVAHDDIYSFLEDYDVGLAFYKNTNFNNYYCAPNKVYDYIQLGMPVITNDHPGLKEIIADNKIGICISEVSMIHLQTAVKAIKNHHMLIPNTLRRRYSWEHQEAGYRHLFDQPRLNLV
jgi:glycosyltransferase involved in cell wall biosynthesis